MFCSSCGKRLPSETQACPSCGSSSHLVRIEGDPLKRPGLITLIAVLDLVGGALVLLGGVGLADMSAKDPSALVLGVPLLLLGGIQAATGIGLLALKPWARTAQIVLSIIGLLGLPIGTVISALFLYYLFKPGCKLLFSGKNRDALTAEDLRAIADLRSGAAATAVVLIVLPVAGLFLCGIISAIAIPNFLNAVDRGKQKRTMADIRTIATAVEAFAIENDGYPTAGRIAELRAVLEPRYVSTLPSQDGWGRPIEVDCAADGCRFASRGKDGAVDVLPPRGPTGHFNDDIVFDSGQFVQWPEGFQR